MNNSEKKKKLVLIDLDGVLNEYSGDFQKNFIRPPKTETKNFLKKYPKILKLKFLQQETNY